MIVIRHIKVALGEHIWTKILKLTPYDESAKREKHRNLCMYTPELDQNNSDRLKTKTGYVSF